MPKSAENNAELSQEALQDLVIESDAGARDPSSLLAKNILLSLAFTWSLFQLWIASPLPFSLGIFVFNDTETRSIHLGFAILLAFLAYPAFKNSPRRRIPLFDWVFAIVGAFCALYFFIFYEELSHRTGIPTTLDITVACTGLLIMLEATRRALGPPLLIIAVIFLLYTYFGSMDFVPDLIRHKGQSLAKIASHQWLTTEGVFGIALGVSTSFVFLFVLFGALLERAGAGNYFIKVAFSLLGHMRGGPAKAAVLSSGMTGLISGSSIANTVTTGTFTIPLMKRVGFTGEKAGAVEVASSVNGQIMPPVMGAAAFLMVEYVGIPYIEVIKHAFLPALISYIALLYLVHLEALKADMQALPKLIDRTPTQRLISAGITVTSIIIFCSVIYVFLSKESCFFQNDAGAGGLCINGLKYYAGKHATFVIGALLLVSYVLLVRYACTVPELEKDDPNAPVVSLPETKPTLKTGLHYLLPIAVLVWCLMVERLSPGLSAFWATLFMIFIITTQKGLKAFFRKTTSVSNGLKEGGGDFVEGMITGARNMIGIGVATAAAGIIVGTVSLTGVGQVLTEVIEALSGGSLILVLIFTAIICLILGMGLPTTANYIVVASLMAHVVQELGAQNGLFVPLIAIHLFVFYFGIMADVTPPVGLASFAAAAISGADPIRTGIQAFAYSMRTAILPFFFIFNTELIMVGVDSLAHALWVFFYATIAILVFSAGMIGYFIVRNRFFETLLLILISVTLFVPQLWIDLFYPKFESVNHMQLLEHIEKGVVGEKVRLEVRGINLRGKEETLQVYVPITGSGSGEEQLEEFGIITSPGRGDTLVVDDVVFNSMAEKAGIDFDYTIISASVTHEQPNAKFMHIPAFLLLIAVVMIQTVRKRKESVLGKLSAAEG